MACLRVCRFALGLMLLVSAVADARSDVPATLAKLESAQLQTSTAHQIASLKLAVPAGALTIEDGLLFAAEPIEGRVRELVLLGAARLEFQPANSVEAHQLDVFTGTREFDEAVTEAVLVLNDPRVVDALLAKPSTAPSAQQAQQATEFFSAWTSSAERRLLRVETAIVRSMLNDSGAGSYVAGWLQGPRLGRFIYSVDPWRPEQVLLGQFVPATLSKRDERKVRRHIAKESRRMNLVGFDYADLGVWNTWAEQSLQRNGVSVPGSSGFEPTHYSLDVVLSPRDEEFTGTARITLRTDGLAGSTVDLFANPGVEIQTVRRVLDGEPGQPLHTETSAGTTSVFLVQPHSEDTPVILEVRFRSGSLLQRLAVSGIESFSLGDTVNWYPHVGDFDLATYDLSIDWPQKFEVMATGSKSAESKEGGRLKASWRVEKPTLAASFEVGRYEVREAHVGEMKVRLAIDKMGTALLDDYDVLLEYIVGPLEFLQTTFGELGYQELTFVTTPRAFSQSLQGMVTLSVLMMSDDALLQRLGFSDPRTVIAHEIAHQWWGHRVAWVHDRDQWLSEALADYSAELYADQVIGDLGGWDSPTEGWNTDVRREAGSLAVSDLGPVVLGDRLNSSLSSDAYFPVVYKKGALVVQMLAGLVGEERLNQILKSVAIQLDFAAVTTEMLLDAVAKSSGLDLDHFVERFVYGVDLPRMEVSYEIQAAQEGTWPISADVRLVAPIETRFRIVRRDDGALGVVRSRTLGPTSSIPNLTLPVDVLVKKQAGTPARSGKKKRKKDSDDTMTFSGAVVLSPDNPSLTLQLPQEPVSVSFDPGRQTYTVFFDTVDREAAKRSRDAVALLAAGSRGEAEDLLLSVVAESDFKPEETLWARLELLRLRIEDAELESAEEQLAQIDRSVRKEGWPSRRLRRQREALAAKLLMAQGRVSTAIRRLESESADGGLGFEGTLVLGTALHRAGEARKLQVWLEDNFAALHRVGGSELLRSP